MRELRTELLFGLKLAYVSYPLEIVSPCAGPITQGMVKACSHINAIGFLQGSFRLQLQGDAILSSDNKGICRRVRPEVELTRLAQSATRAARTAVIILAQHHSQTSSSKAM